MTEYALDVETCSLVDLAEVGAYRYSIDPSTRVLCVAYTKKGDMAATLWYPGLVAPTFQPDDVFTGYNIVGFDRLIWKNIMSARYLWPEPNFKFIDTMHRAAYTNLPGNLDAVAKALGSTPKDAEGHKLMLHLCKPYRNGWSHHNAKDISRLAAYCAQDTYAEAAIGAQLPMLPAGEQRIAEVDRAVNDDGLFIDQRLVRACISAAAGIADFKRERLSKITRGAIESETALPKIKAFCRSRGLVINEGKGAFDKEAVIGFLKDKTIDPVVREVLEIRQLIGRSSITKFQRMLGAVCPDGRLRGTLQYYGAHQTGRWAGRIIQPQNFPRRKLPDYPTAIAAALHGADCMDLLFGDDALDVITGLLRPCIHASPGNTLHVSDYNAIECRVLAWVCNDEKLLQAFRDGRCPYKEMASVIFGVPYDKVTKSQRDLGKVIILACGYGMGGRKKPNGDHSRFYETAEAWGMPVTDEEALKYVTLYRDRHRKIQQMWYAVDDAAKNAIRNPNKIYQVERLAFKFDGVNLYMRLPSGVILWYRQAHLVQKLDPETGEARTQIYFWGEQDTGVWGTCYTYGGKLVENACQAISRGLTAEALVRAYDAGMRPVLTVHDEIVCENALSDSSGLVDVMCASASWADGLPVKAEGFTSPYYRK